MRSYFQRNKIRRNRATRIGAIPSRVRRKFRFEQLEERQVLNGYTVTFDGSAYFAGNPRRWEALSYTVEAFAPSDHRDDLAGQFAVSVSGPVSAQFNTFCVDLAPNHTLTLGMNVFPVVPQADLSAITPPAVAPTMMSNPFGRIAYLYNHYGTTSLSGQLAAALQVAIWELEYDPNPSDIEDGTFKLTGFDSNFTTLSAFNAVISQANAYIAESAGKSEKAIFLKFDGSGGGQGMLAPPARVGDFVWNDANGNGIQDSGEDGIPGVTLTLTGMDIFGNLVTDHATTDSTGHYQFVEFPGTYQVAVDASNFVVGGALNGLIPTLPLQGGNPAKDSNNNPSGTAPMTLTFGGSDQTIDFGYKHQPAHEDIVGIDLVKLTNGTDNDKPTGPLVPVGSTVTWTYQVTNTGNVPISNVMVTDSVAGVGPTPVLSGGYNVGDTSHDNLLDVGEHWLFTATGTAIVGQYTNVGTVTGTAMLTGGGTAPVTDTNPDHYFGYTTNISILKLTNGTNNDSPPGLFILAGSPVTWTYNVTTTGNVPLSSVTVTDNVAGVSPAPVLSGGYNVGDTSHDNLLQAGETWVFTAGGTAIAGQYTNVGTTTGIPSDFSGNPIPGAQTQTDSNPDNYFGYLLAGIGDYLWLDKNRNGQQDGAEPGINGVTVKLLDATGTTVLETTTTGDNPHLAGTQSGYYEFTGLVPGTYVVQFSTGGGYDQFTVKDSGSDVTDSDVDQTTGKTGAYTLASGEFNSTVDAGLLPIDLELTKSVNNTTPAVGTNVVFTVTVTNNNAAPGVSTATGVTVKDLLPSGLAYVSDDSSGAYSGNTWTVSTLGPGASATIHITATVTSAGTKTNFAQVQTAGQIDTDSTPGNNTDTGSRTPYEDDEASVSLTPSGTATLAGCVYVDANGNGVEDEQSFSGVVGSGAIGLGAAGNFAVLGINGGNVILNSSSIVGNIGIGPIETASTLQKTNLTGSVLVDTGAGSVDTSNLSTDFVIVGGQFLSGQSLTQAQNDANAASTAYAALATDTGFALGNVTNSTIVAATSASRADGVTAISMTSLNYNSDILTISGNASDLFVINVTGNFTFYQSQIVLSGGVTADHVIFNFPNASSIDLSKDSNVIYGTFLAPQGSVIYHNPANFHGEIIAKNIDIHSAANLTANEPCIPGVTVTLYNSAGMQVGQQVTTATGYSFTNLPADTYKVVEGNSPPGLFKEVANPGTGANVQGTASGSDQIIGIGLVGANNAVEYDFGLVATATPKLAVTKTADSATITAGQTIGFTVTITNPGSANLLGVTLSDALPAGTGGDVNWTIDTSGTGFGAGTTPADFVITGAIGSQSLGLSSYFINTLGDSLAPGQSISVHIVSPTNSGDASGGGALASNQYGFNGTAIQFGSAPGGSYVWYNSHFTAQNMPTSGTVHFHITNQRISLPSYTDPVTHATVPAQQLVVPDAKIIYTDTVSIATTTFTAGQWVTTVPLGYTGNVFFSGLAYQVPANGLPGGLKPVTWTGTFTVDETLAKAPTLQWQWGAAAYSKFDSTPGTPGFQAGDYNALQVKPVDSNTLSAYQNSDHSGVPEGTIGTSPIKSYVVGGGSGGGGSNWTGSNSGTIKITPAKGGGQLVNTATVTAANVIADSNDTATATISIALPLVSADSGIVASGSAIVGTNYSLAQGTILVYVDNSSVSLTPAEQARIDDAIATYNSELAPYGLTLVEVGHGQAALAIITINVANTTEIGGAANGVLGVTRLNHSITLVAGWNWYVGSDPSQIGAGEYDFQTIVTHELGHAVGLGHSSGSNSVMYPYLAPGAIRRTLSVDDLSLLQKAEVDTSPDPLLALPPVNSPSGPIVTAIGADVASVANPHQAVVTTQHEVSAIALAVFEQQQHSALEQLLPPRLTISPAVVGLETSANRQGNGALLKPAGPLAGASHPQLLFAAAANFGQARQAERDLFFSRLGADMLAVQGSHDVKVNAHQAMPLHEGQKGRARQGSDEIDANDVAADWVDADYHQPNAADGAATCGLELHDHASLAAAALVLACLGLDRTADDSIRRKRSAALISGSMGRGWA